MCGGGGFGEVWTKCEGFEFEARVDLGENIKNTIRMNKTDTKHSSQENIAFLKYLRESRDSILFPNTPLQAWKDSFVLAFRNVESFAEKWK